MGLIVDKFIAELDAQLLERKIKVELTAAAKVRLAEKGYDKDFGARPLARLIQREIKDPLSDEVLFGRLVKGGKVRVDASEDGFAFEFSERVKVSS
jgi:ATP-dependent Clp protease ATP-binding subunit ClpA